MSKIGTGEGAQAYGHGLYFADSEDVAKNYRDNLSVKGGGGIADKYLTNFGGDKERAAAALSELIEKQSKDFAPEFLEPKREALRILQSGAEPNAKGSMYQVRINADPEHFLDWDKPLSEQSPVVRSAAQSLGVMKAETPENEVRAMVRNIMDEGGHDEQVAIQYAYEDINKKMSAALRAGNDAEYDRLADMDFAIRQWWDSGTMAKEATGMDPSGGAFLQEIERSLVGSTNIAGQRDPLAASRRLLEAGIPGIKYLDGGSRAAGDGSRNYVVFDAGLIDILKKYGLVGLLGGGAAINSQSPNAQQGAPGL